MRNPYEEGQTKHVQPATRSHGPSCYGPTVACCPHSSGECRWAASCTLQAKAMPLRACKLLNAKNAGRAPMKYMGSYWTHIFSKQAGQPFCSPPRSSAGRRVATQSMPCKAAHQHLQLTLSCRSFKVLNAEHHHCNVAFLHGVHETPSGSEQPGCRLSSSKNNRSCQPVLSSRVFKACARGLSALLPAWLMNTSHLWQAGAS